MAEVNSYAVLGLEKGLESTEQEVKKAYRKLALKLHPDKNPDDPNAVTKFNELQNAYEVLMDEDARKAHDALFRVREQKAASRMQQNAKRRKMMDDLEQREKAAETQDEEKSAKQRLHMELERLRRQAAERRAQSQSHQAPAAAVPPAPPPPPTPAEAAAAARTLKVTWSKRAGDYAVSDLRSAFAEFGEVEDVLIRDGKKKKGSAIVVMGTEGAASKAATSACGDLGNPLLVLQMSKLAAAGGAGGPEEEQLPPPPAAAAAPAPATAPTPGGRAGGAAPAFGVGGKGGGSTLPMPAFMGGAGVGAVQKDFENVTLMRMRQAQERARLIAEMEREEG